MSGLRLAGAALVALCGALFGLFLARGKSQHRRELECFLQLLQLLRQYLQYERAPTAEILRRVCAEPGLSALVLQPEQPLWQQTPPGFSSEEAALWRDTLSLLGAAGTEVQCARFEQAAQQLLPHIQQARGSEQQALALYGKLGLGLGVMAALALL